MAQGGWSGRAKLRLAIGILLVVSIAVAAYFTFYTERSCSSYQCFKDSMTACSKVRYINEEPDASWQYNILGTQGGACQIQVTLLQAKTGPLDLEKLAGYNMICSYPVGVADYPEKNLNACTGRLKEEMQGIIIKKLYAYILSNLGEVKESLTSALQA
jgi:hypothetical protein